jgi:hypothetical protein
MSNMCRFVLVGVICTVIAIATLTCAYLLAYLIANYQSSETIIRYTYADGSVQVVGGRVPWRRSDAVFGGEISEEEQPTMALYTRNEQGEYDKRELVKVEFWFREKDAATRLRRAFELLHSR